MKVIKKIYLSDSYSIPGAISSSGIDINLAFELRIIKPSKFNGEAILIMEQYDE